MDVCTIDDIKYSHNVCEGLKTVIDLMTLNFNQNYFCQFYSYHMLSATYVLLKLKVLSFVMENRTQSYIYLRPLYDSFICYIRKLWP